MKYFKIWLSVFCLLFTNSLNAEPIEDNSFLIEEAYNQEPNVVQHINTFFYNWDDAWDYSFTQEWPVISQDHQLSYTIPIIHTDEFGSDIGDIALNYRYQVLSSEVVAASPRFSIVIPTGDEDESYGLGATGFEIASPLSIKLSKNLVAHWNLGYSVTPDADNSIDNKTISSHFYGASIVYLLSDNFNLLLEMSGSSEESFGEESREEELLINPGLRFAINSGNLQIVPGLSFPIGIGPQEGDTGVFFYLSFEHDY